MLQNLPEWLRYIATDPVVNVTAISKSMLSRLGMPAILIKGIMSLPICVRFHLNLHELEETSSMDIVK